MAHLIWNRLGLGWDFNSGGVRIAFKGWSRLLVLKAIKSRVVATGAADTVRILQLYTWKNVKNHPKERFIGGTLLLGATQFNFELYLQISSVLKIKPHVQRCGSENFYLPFSFWVIFVCCAETLCSCTPWPCLSLTASAWLHIVYRGIILYSPQNSLTLGEETFCSQCRNTRTLLIGLFLREKRAPIEEANSAATFQSWILWTINDKHSSVADKQVWVFDQ